MRWFFRIKEKSDRLIIYSYSREEDSLDGLIIYDTKKQTASVMRPASTDKNNKKVQQKVIEHFWRVVGEGFPEERYIACG